MLYIIRRIYTQKTINKRLITGNNKTKYHSKLLQFIKFLWYLIFLFFFWKLNYRRQSIDKCASGSLAIYGAIKICFDWLFDCVNEAWLRLCGRRRTLRFSKELSSSKSSRPAWSSSSLSRISSRLQRLACRLTPIHRDRRTSDRGGVRRSSLPLRRSLSDAVGDQLI